ATTGGSGSFYHLAVMARRDGGLVQRALAPLGDRVQVRRAAALAGGFELEVVEAGPGDAACCPGQRVLRRWALAGKTLRELPPAPLGRLGTDALGGITWQLQALASGLPLPPGNGVVVTFSADEVSGTAGCNSFFGGVRAGDRPGEVRIGPLMKTTTACADYADALEATFLARLVDVERFTFLGTRLALSYRNGQAFDLLLFSQLE
ncbi:MAG TPA: META domain-containing protein, partial [Gammaproteobacteria bacterium]